MDEQALRKIEERAEQATPGPWDAGISRDEQHGEMWYSHKVWPLICKIATKFAPDTEIGGVDVANFEFIAHAREDIPALVAEVRRLQGEVKQLERDKETLTNASAEKGIWII